MNEITSHGETKLGTPENPHKFFMCQEFLNGVEDGTKTLQMSLLNSDTKKVQRGDKVQFESHEGNQVEVEIVNLRIYNLHNILHFHNIVSSQPVIIGNDLLSNEPILDRTSINVLKIIFENEKLQQLLPGSREVSMTLEEFQSQVYDKIFQSSDTSDYVIWEIKKVSS